MGAPLVVRLGAPQRRHGVLQKPLLDQLHAERQVILREIEEAAQEAHKEWDESDLSGETPEREAASQEPCGKSPHLELLLLLLMLLLVVLLPLPVLMLLLLLMGGASHNYCREHQLRRLLLPHLPGAERVAAPSPVQPSTRLRTSGL